MFNFLKNRKVISPTERVYYQTILGDIREMLMQAQLPGQYKIVTHLLFLLNRSEDKLFIKNLNSLDLWGGSGAVWEVGIEDKELETKYIKGLIKLIDYMEETRLLGKGIKQIRRVLYKSLESNS